MVDLSKIFLFALLISATAFGAKKKARRYGARSFLGGLFGKSDTGDRISSSRDPVYSFSYPGPTQGGGFPPLNPGNTQGGGYRFKYPGNTQGGGYSSLYPGTIQGGVYPPRYPSANQSGGYRSRYPGTTQGGGYPSRYPGTIQSGGYPSRYPGLTQGGVYATRYPGTSQVGGYSPRYPGTSQGVLNPLINNPTGFGGNSYSGSSRKANLENKQISDSFDNSDEFDYM